MALCIWSSDIRIDTSSWFPIGFTLIPIIIAVFGVLIHTNALRKMKDMGHFDKRLEVTINDNEIQFKHDTGEVRLNWVNFYKTTETKEHFLLIYKKNRNAYQFIPKSAFASVNELESFKNQIKLNIPNYESYITKKEMPKKTRIVWGVFIFCIIMLLIQAVIDQTK